MQVRLKPISSRVEIDLSIDLDSQNIDRDFADKYSITKQTLHTPWEPATANGCVVGLLTGDKLHLHPISAIVQLRPSLKHLNPGGSERKNIISTTVKIEGPSEEKSAATSKKQKKQMEPPTEQKSDEVECWVPLKYHDCKSDISSRYLQQMVAQESTPMNFTVSPYDYVTTLCPALSSNSLPKGPSKRYLLSLPLTVEERLHKMFIEGPPLRRFNAIKHFAPEYSDKELLEYLQKHAVLLWGLWTPKSGFLISKPGFEQLARDYVLILFSKNLNVRSSDVIVNFQGELGNSVRNFLRKFGLERCDINKTMSQPMTYWKLRELPDESFKKLHPDVVKIQEDKFTALDHNVTNSISKFVKPKRGQSAMTNHSVKSELVKSANSDPRVTSLGGVPPGKMTMSNETRHALPIALKKLFQTHQVCSFQFIREELRKMAVSKTTLSKGDSKIAVDAAHSLDGPEHELKAVISDVACDIHGYYVLKSSQDDPFRDVVIDLLRGSGPNAKLKKAEILEAARLKLRREVPNNEFTKVMKELCVSKGSVWVLKSGDGSM